MLSADCPAYILAGGQSRRFGGNKALAQINGQPQLLRLADQVARAGHTAHVVSDRADRYAELGMDSLVDPVADCGPMSGLLAALLHTLHSQQVDKNARAQDKPAGGWLLLISCDQLLWRQEWFEQLTNRPLAGCGAVAFKDTNLQDSGPFPLPGIYHTSLIDAIEQSMATGQLSLRRFMAKLPNCQHITTPHPPSAWSFNTPEELLGLLKQHE